MTVVGVGGVIINTVTPSKRYQKEYRKLTNEMRSRVDDKINDLLATPRPAGISFEKLSGYANPDIYTIHITGNYKLSFEINGQSAFLRRVANHDQIDRAP